MVNGDGKMENCYFAKCSAPRYPLTPKTLSRRVPQPCSKNSYVFNYPLDKTPTSLQQHSSYQRDLSGVVKLTLSSCDCRGLGDRIRDRIRAQPLRNEDVIVTAEPSMAVGSATPFLRESRDPHRVTRTAAMPEERERAM